MKNFKKLFYFFRIYFNLNNSKSLHLRHQVYAGVSSILADAEHNPTTPA
jgi:hypothetical protein